MAKTSDNYQAQLATYIQSLLDKYPGDLANALAELLVTGFDISGVIKVTGVPPGGPP